MKLLDILSKKKITESLEHKINPVYDTAKDCLSNLVKAGCQEAYVLNKELKFTEEEKAKNAINKGTGLFQELRYQFVNDVIRKSGYKNILDIGCGYSPRGILFAKDKYHYVGADLPAAIKEVEPAVKNCFNDSTYIKYIAVDATNPQSLVDAAKDLNGPICIVSEGLFMYLPLYELNEYIKGLKKVLEIHGGCIITPDFSMNKLLKISLNATSNKLLGHLLQKIAEKVVEGYTVPSNNESDSLNWYTKEGDEDPYKYFVEKGFSIERLPIYNSDINLNSLNYVKKNKKDKFIEDCSNTYGWKVTLRK